MKRIPANFCFLALVMLCGAMSPVFAHGQSGTSGGTVFGIAVDSVRGGYLTGAIVSVRGSTRSAFTDSVGRFSIDNVALGEVRLELSHPFLDTLAIAVVTAPMTLTAGQNLRTVVSIPSTTTIVRAKCTAQEVETGPAALIGNVYDADSDSPAAGARVLLVWVDYLLGPRSATKAPRQRITETGVDGSFRICGLPEGLTANVSVRRGRIVTPEVGIDFGRHLAVATLFLHGPAPVTRDSAPSTSQQRLPATGTATLSGKILNPVGGPLANARVAVDETDAVAITAADGTFTLGSLPSGTRIVSVRALGYEPIESAVALRARIPASLTLRLRRFALSLDTVRVTALRDIAMQRVGFDERRKARFGKFFDPDDIQRRAPLRLNSLLETLPGLTYRSGNEMGGRRTLGPRRGCLNYVVDGKPWRSDDPDSWISAQELGAVEYYSDGSVPAEFVSLTGGAPCSVIVIWTKWYLRLK